MRTIQRLSYRGKILPMRCGEATWNTWQIQRLTIAMVISQVLASSVYHPQKESIIKFMTYTHTKRQKTQSTYKKGSTYIGPAII